MGLHGCAWYLLGVMHAGSCCPLGLLATNLHILLWGWLLCPGRCLVLLYGSLSILLWVPVLYGMEETLMIVLTPY